MYLFCKTGTWPTVLEKTFITAKGEKYISVKRKIVYWSAKRKISKRTSLKQGAVDV